MVAVASCSNATDSTSSISYKEVRNWLEKTPVLKGEKWFVVGAQWFSRFIGQFEELSDTQFSPKQCGKITPIDNSDLLDENQKIRPDLILDMDYRIIPKECWDRLVSEYKMKHGQKPIPVSIIQDGDALGPELYFYHVTLVKNNCSDKSIRSYSRTTTLLEIEEDMREFFKVSREKYPEARLKLKPMPDCEWIPVANKSVPLMDTGASNSSEIKIDVEASSYWDDVINDPSAGLLTYFDDVKKDPSAGLLKHDNGYNTMVPSPSLPSSTVNGEHESKALLPLTADAASQYANLDEDYSNRDGSVDASPSESGDTFGPRTLQETMEQQACSDISNVGLMSTPSSTSIFKSDITTNDAYLNGAMNGTETGIGAPIALPYTGPLNPPESGPIALPYGPLPQGESCSSISNIEEPSEPGVCGLRNLGNSCYMNSALQCLSNVKPLCDYFRSNQWKDDINTENKDGLKGDLAAEYANLMHDLWSGKFKSVYPREMKKMMGLKDSQFIGSRQHDSQELMSTVINGLHEDLKKPSVKVENGSVENGVSENGDAENGECDNQLSLEARAEEAKREHRQRENSRIIDLFYGYQKSTVVCSKCMNKSERFEPIHMLSLSLPGGNLCHLDITFVSTGNPRSRPVRHMIEVESTGTVLDLLRKTAEVTKSDVSRLWAAEICSYKVNQHLATNLSISSVSGLFQIYVYERPALSHNGVHNGDADEAMDECSMGDGEVIVNGGGETDENDRSAADIQPVVINMVDDLIHLPFGQPIVYFPSQVPSSLSVEHLTELVVSQGSRYIKRPSPDSDSSAWWKDYPSKHPCASSITNSTTSSLPDLRHTSSAYGERETTGSAVSMDDSNGSAAEEGPPMFTLWEVDNLGNRHRLETDAVVKIPGDKMVRMTAIWDRRAKNKFYDDVEANSVKYPSTPKLSSNSLRKTTLSECLDLHTREERLDGCNTFECSKCPRSEDGRLARCPATKKIDLWELPPVLIVHFKRFNFMTHTTKPEIEVRIPVTGLTLQPWLEGPQSTSLYDLVAVSNHSGRTLNYGHYTSLAKNWLDGKWYKFDDDDVTEVEPRIDGELAYILVYVRRETDNGTVNGEEDMEIA